MNAIHDKYATKGLVLLGVSRESGDRLADWAKKRSARYPIVSAPQGGTKYGIRGYPTYYLVSASGTVLAGPQHGKFSADQIETALKAVVLFPEIPDMLRLMTLKKATAAKKMLNIARALSQLEQAEGLTQTESDTVQKVRKAFDGMVESATAEIAQLGKGPDYPAAKERLEELAKTYKGLPVEADVQAQLAHFAKDKTIKRELKASNQLAGFRKRYPLNKYSNRKKLHKAMVGLIKKYPGTTAATKAQKVIDRIQRLR